VTDYQSLTFLSYDTGRIKTPRTTVLILLRVYSLPQEHVYLVVV
jgi:hypothetical protein